MPLALGDQPERLIAEGSLYAGTCMCCHRTLTDATSRARGIGPECFGRAPAALRRAWDDQRQREQGFVAHAAEEAQRRRAAGEVTAAEA